MAEKRRLGSGKRETKEKRYNPLDHSVVQGLIRNEPHEEFEATDFHEALVFGIAREIGRVHQNRYQAPWDRWSDDPHIPGIQWRRYTYDCDCPETGDGFIPQHREDCVMLQPNFGFEEVRFCWYKNPGRGMSVNRQWPPSEWAAWFSRCIAKIREFDVKISGLSDEWLRPLPTVENLHQARVAICWKTDSKQYRDVIDPQLAGLEVEIKKADAQETKGWGKIIPGGPNRSWLLKAVAVGIAAEKARAQREK